MESCIAEIEKENKRRMAVYFRQYDAKAGDPKGEVVERRLAMVMGQEMWLPVSMTVDYPGDVAAGGQEAEQRFHRVRCMHDFEYWCITCVHIQDKLSKRMIPFRLNYGQRQAARMFEAARLKGEPIRVIIVKARQWGGSTVTQIYMLWLQLFHYKRWHSAIVCQLKNQAINIRGMLSQVIAAYPGGEFSITGYEGLSGVRYIPQRGCKIQTGSAEMPDALRSFDFSMLHLSEVGLWKSTPARSAEDLVQALYSTVPAVAGTLIVMESTAKGVGNFFHNTFLAAQRGESLMRPLFVPWFVNENYAHFRHDATGQGISRGADGLPVSALDNTEGLIKSFGMREWEQWRNGATLEGIAWYRDTQRGFQYSDFMMRSEFPGSASEAFQTRSNRYFEHEAVERQRQMCCRPAVVGDLRGRGGKGADALRDICLVAHSCPQCELRIWKRPGEGGAEAVSNRYVVVTDIGGVGPAADWSVISVFDRAGLMEHGGAMERAATWRGHIDHDLLAWKAAQIARYYHNALLVIESNTLETKDQKAADCGGSPHFYTVIDEIADHYPNLYMRLSPPEVAGGEPTRRYGWHTNVRTKYLAYDQCRASLRDGEYVERDSRCADEMDFLEIKPNGSLGAIAGQHDDIVDTTAIALYVSTHEMPLPAVARERRSAPAGGVRGGVATF